MKRFVILLYCVCFVLQHQIEPLQKSDSIVEVICTMQYKN